MSSLTAKQAEALRLVREHGPIFPGRFAELMWPDSPSWHRHSKCGPYGATTGAGARKAGGSFLTRLARKDLIQNKWDRDRQTGYSLLAAGRRALKEYEQRAGEDGT